MAKLTVRITAGQERGRQWDHHFKTRKDHAVVTRFLQWKAPELTTGEGEVIGAVEEYVDEYTTEGELRYSRLIRRNKLAAAEYY